VPNLGVALPLSAAATNLLVGALYFAIARAPGWRIARLYGWIALAAGLYSTLNLIYPIGGLSDAVYLAAGRLSYFAGTVQCVIWLVYAYSDNSGSLRTAPGPVRWIALSTLAAGLFFAATGWLVTTPVSPVRIAWAGVTYHYPLATVAGDIYGFVVLALPSAAVLRLARRVRRGERFLAWQAGLLAVVLVFAIEEVLVANRIIDFLSLLDLGFLILVVPFSWRVIERVIGDARQLRDLSDHLKERTAELETANANLREEVAQRERAQDVLRVSEKRLREAQRVGHTGYLDWDIQTNKIESSDETCRIYGFEPGTVHPTLASTLALVPAEDKARVEQQLALALSGVAEYDIEHRLIRPDGEVIHVHARGEVTRAADGKPLRMLGTMADITGRKQAEEALRRNEAFLRNITDLVPSRIAYLDRDQRFRFVNARHEEWFGCRREEIVGRHMEEVLGQPQYDRVRPHVQAVLSGRPVQFEIDKQRDPGPPRQLSVVYVPHFAGNGEVLGFFASIDDITERKHLEEQVRQSQKMEAVGILAGGIAHDFNNLMTVIIGYSQHALARLGPDHPVSRNVQEVFKAGEQAASLTRQLLAFSRKQMLQPKVLDLNALIRGFELMLRRLIEAHFDLKLDLDPGLGRVKADPTQMQQVLMNLVVNARDAMPDGGELTIKTRNARLNGADFGAAAGGQLGDWVLLAVSDTGHGMDEATQRRIFEPFFTTKGMGRGTGLGLSTTYGIVNQSGGHITVSSKPGHGTTFQIYLPRTADLEEAIRPANPAPKPPAGAETILLVEDEPSLRGMVRDTLSEHGYVVLEAEDGNAALELSERHAGAIHLLLTDVVMPRLGGRELAQRLIQQRPHLRVLYISGYSETIIAGQVLRDQRADLLQKPFAIDDLVQRVGKLLAAGV
jgi:PAS domain S-box-containing protein